MEFNRQHNGHTDGHTDSVIFILLRFTSEARQPLLLLLLSPVHSHVLTSGTHEDAGQATARP